MGEQVIIAADIIGFLFLFVVFYGLQSVNEKAKISVTLTNICMVSMIGLVIEAVSYSVDSIGLPDALIYILCLLSYCMGTLSLIFIGYFLYLFLFENNSMICDSDTEGSGSDTENSRKTGLKQKKSLFFYIPTVVIVIAFIYLLYLAISGDIFRVENSHVILTGGMPVEVSVIQILFLVYISLMLIIKKKELDKKTVFVLSTVNIIPLFAVVLTFIGLPDFTYVASALSVLIVYVFLQSRKARETKEALDIQNERLQAMANIYNTMHIINLKNDTVLECKSTEGVKQFVHRQNGAVKVMRETISKYTAPEFLEKALEYTDLTTLPDRMKGVNTLSDEFVASTERWFRGRFVAIDRDENDRVTEVIFITIIVQDEKSKEEGLIRISKMDALTQVNNRRAFEEAVKKYDEKMPDNMTIIACDINGLKTVNDTLGHAAGDELIQGATQCMISAFAGYGEIYRTGGDEFVVLSTVDYDMLTFLIERLKYSMATWEGEKVKEVSISFDFVRSSEFPEKSMAELLAVADERMYEIKQLYYNQTGTNRRKN